MIDWCIASLISTSIGLYLFSRRCQKQIDEFVSVLGRSVYAMCQFRVADREHTRICQQAALRVTARLCIVVASLAVICLLASIPFWVLNLEELKGLRSLVWITIGAVVPVVFYARHLRRSSATEYPPSKQLFYYMTLGSPAAIRVLGPIERALCQPPVRPEEAIVITGLARAGTTALLRHLNLHPQTWSFTYRHMPFLSASRLWVKVNRRKPAARERSHADGILVDLDSPEAFDEYFWRVLLRESFYTPGGLRVHEVNESIICQYERLISQHLRPGQIYLTKNNTFMLRYRSFAEARPDYQVVVVFREPIDHAASLLRQHRIQCAEQQECPFVVDYMDLLGHHEFGRHRRDFLFDDHPYRFAAMETLNYWLERWVRYYAYVIEYGMTLVSNESLARHPNEVIDNILSRYGMDFDKVLPCSPQRARRSADSDDVCASLLEEANALYRILLDRSASETVTV